MKMTTRSIIFGSLLILAAIIFMVVYIPYANREEAPSEIFRARVPAESSGRAIYIANGCVYCHSQSIRSIDWGLGAERIAQAGDYIQDKPILLGSARTGPDLSQAGGEHPDDWHTAHFINPRYTRPLSIMPPFEFLGPKPINSDRKQMSNGSMPMFRRDGATFPIPTRPPKPAWHGDIKFIRIFV